MSTAWRWKCQVCADEFVLSLERIPAPCRRCGGEWFLKVGESDDERPGSGTHVLSAKRFT